MLSSLISRKFARSIGRLDRGRLSGEILMSKMMIVIDPSGQRVEIPFSPNQDGEPPLKELQSMIGGVFEMHYVQFDSTRCRAYVNQHSNGLKPNRQATAIMRSSGLRVLGEIHGNIALLPEV
jgi:hypothetical protein